MVPYTPKVSLTQEALFQKPDYIKLGNPFNNTSGAMTQKFTQGLERDRGGGASA